MDLPNHPYIVDPGHIYMLPNVDDPGANLLTFIKRSGGAVTHDVEYPGTNVQSVVRVLIDRTKYLDSIIPCVENADVIHYLRMVLLSYEGRAWRRKLDKVNREASEHESFRERNRDLPFDEGGFKSDGRMEGIENCPVGDDGHILVDLQWL